MSRVHPSLRAALGTLAILFVLPTVFGATLAVTSPTYRFALPVAFGLLSFVMVRACVSSRLLGWLDPLVWMVLPLAVIFVVRPLAILASHQFIYLNYDISHVYNKVMILGLAGLSTLWLGYQLAWPARAAARLRPLPTTYDEHSLTLFAYLLVVLGMAGYALFIAKTGISPASVISQGLPVGTAQQATAYFALAPLLVLPATLFLFRAGLRTRSVYLLASSALLLLVMVSAFAPTGSRFQTLIFVGAFLLYPLQRYNWRPPRWLAIVGLCVVLIFVQATANAVSGVQSSQDQGLASALLATAEHPAQSAQKLVLGPTIEMFSGLGAEVQVVPSQTGFHPLGSITSLVAGPIPRSVLPNKPYAADQVVDAAAFGVKLGTNSVEFSPVGEFYYDGGLIGVLIGMAAIGTLLRFMSEYASRNRDNDMNRVLLSAALPLIPVLARATLAATFGQVIFLLVPIPLVALLAGRSRGSPGVIQPRESRDARR